MGEHDLEYDLAASGVLDVMTTPGLAGRPLGRPPTRLLEDLTILPSYLRVVIALAQGEIQ